MCFCVHFCVSVLPTIDSRGIAGDFTGCGQVLDTTHQFGGEAEYSLIFLYVCAYATMVWNWQVQTDGDDRSRDVAVAVWYFILESNVGVAAAAPPFAYEVGKMCRDRYAVI